MYVIDTINDGTLYLRGLCEETVQIGRYAADYGVAFPDLLNTVDEGQLQHTKLCLLSSKTNRTILKWFEAHFQLSFSVTAMHSKTILYSHCRVLFGSGVVFQRWV